MFQQEGSEEAQFMSEISRFLRDKGGWEPQSAVVIKGRTEILTPLSHYCALGFPSSLISQKPREFRLKLNFFSPPLNNVPSWTGTEQKEFHLKICPVSHTFHVLSKQVFGNLSKTIHCAEYFRKNSTQKNILRHFIDVYLQNVI